MGSPVTNVQFIKLKTTTMKVLFVASAFCFLTVLGFPDSALKLEDPKISTLLAKATHDAAANEIRPETTASTAEPAKKSHASQGTVSDRTKLISDLFRSYNEKVNPDDIKLKFGVALIDFRVRADAQALDTYVWLRKSWNDTRLKWDPKEYGGVEVFRLDPKAVWQPDITLYNSADPVNMVNCWDSNVLIYSSGQILHVPPCKMISHCHFTLNKQPYGEQVCPLKFGPWTFDGNALDMDFYDKKPSVDLSDLNNSSGFEVVTTTAEKHEKYYPCCAEPYVDLTYNITIKRIPGEELFKKL